MVEGEFLGAASGHGRRVAVLAAALAEKRGLPGGLLRRLSICALLHDNALTQYFAAERPELASVDLWQPEAMKMHCEVGQTNIDSFGLEADDIIRYHHERADGSGPFHLHAGEYPVGAELIGIADYLDTRMKLSARRPKELSSIRQFIESLRGTYFTPEGTDNLLDVLDGEMLHKLSDGKIAESAALAIPAWTSEVTETTLPKMADFAMRVIDYKSAFTRKHSSQVARKAYLIGAEYGKDKNELGEIYLAAALHDLGKLAVPSALLEKGGRLTREEYNLIRSHAEITGRLLSGIDGLENISRWAANHHEKLDGSGYPDGLTADKLDFNSRLLACIDIYQAASEERPYHPAREHDDAMRILCALGKTHRIDMEIVSVIDAVLVPYSLQKVPASVVG
jgi:HD-GYP domain-containing protein (c-di-GMP phosphodiesterase class II)